MNWKRIGRVIICLLVVVCLIVNMSPLRAEAVAVVDDLTIGLIALLIAASAGVVYTVNSSNEIKAIGNSMTTYLYQWGTSAEKLDDVDEFVSNLHIYQPDEDNDGDDDPDTPHDKQIKIGKSIMAGLALWLCSLIKGDTAVEVEEEAASGFAFYNGYYLPAIITYSEYLYYYIISHPDGTIHEYASKEKDMYVWEYSGGYVFGTGYYCYEWPLEGYAWGTRSNPLIEANQFSLDEGYRILWSNENVTYNRHSENVYLFGSEPQTLEEFIISPYYVGDIPQQVQDGTLEYGNIELPDIDYSSLFQPGQTAQEAVTKIMNDLATGSLTYPEFLEITKIDPDSDSDAGTSVDPDKDSVSDPLSNTSASSFLDALADLLWAPIRWLADALLNGIKALFVPAEDFLTEKVDALRSEFSFADSIITTAEYIGTALSGLETEPPVIYIDLGASEGSYYLGGKEVFVDLNWYSRYKPTVDLLISAFLWIVFVWRLFIKLPGIISGLPGDFVMDGVNTLGLSDSLPSRNIAYEVQRQSLRQSSRKGSGK